MDKDVVNIYIVECYLAIKMSESGSFVEMWMNLDTVIPYRVK